MSEEIERKFLISHHPDWIKCNNQLIHQSYFRNWGNSEDVVRIRQIDDCYFMTIKSKKSNITCGELEKEISPVLAKELLNSSITSPSIKKLRYFYEHPVDGKIWHIDQFLGSNNGLLIAEIELEYESENFEKPEWVGKEVSLDPKYSNRNLIDEPFSNWN